MIKAKEMLSGVYSPMCTPFENDEVDYAGFEKNVELMNSSGLKGYFVLGTNGEFKTMSEEERFRVLSIAIKKAAPGKIVMAGTGAESTRETIRLTKKAADMGAVMVSLLMPNFFAKKITDEVMIRHITDVADASPIPVVLYNNPSVAAGVTIRPAVIKVVSQHANVAGIKDSSKETWPENVVFNSSDFSVMAGSAGYFLDLLDKGGTGGVLSLANVFPDSCAELYSLYVSGKKAEAVELNKKLVDLNKKVSGAYGVAGVKYAMDLAGFSGGLTRKPLLGLTDEQKKTLEADLKESGFLK
ncbi:MAG: dihydrodipicolinate synthase family protein [Spirochaetia bacterium]|jgi:4-hydroxy-2-oxoglutarate aldolase|nr:dihydrodipicolinate synthase family protein [Spirochaetia bacterium]